MGTRAGEGWMVTRTYTKPAAVSFVQLSPPQDGEGPTLFLARLPSGPIEALDLVGDLIWSAAIRLGEEEAILIEVSQSSGHPVEVIRADTLALLETLTRQGFLDAQGERARTT